MPELPSQNTFPKHFDKNLSRDIVDNIFLRSIRTPAIAIEIFHDD